ncbi:MAG: ABC transporter substrate-binding protein [Acidobacteriota bacterium]
MRHRIALAGLVLACLLSGCRTRERAADSRIAPTPAAAPVPAPKPSPTPRVALGFLDESTEPPADGGVLRLRLVGEPTTLNAVMQSSAPEAQVLQYVQRNVLDFDAQMQLIPGLAEKVEADTAGREFVLTLRADAVWEDRRPVTARDVAFTLAKITDPKIPSNVFKPLFEDLESVQILDEKRLRVRFRAPYAFRSMGFVFPVLPAHRFAGQDFLRSRENRAPLSSGPYRVVSWKAQQSITLERNPAYPGPPGHFDRIVFRILPADTTAYRMLTSGELDEDQVNPALKAKAATDPGFQSCCRMIEFYNLDYSYVALNNRSPLFQDARVRRALTMLLDRASIVRNLFAGSARIISGPWAPDSPAYDADVDALPFDPAAAAKLLDSAGWRDSNGNGIRDRGGREFKFDLLVSEGSEVGRQIDEMLSAELSRVGIAARVRTMEWATFVERVDAGDFSAASLAWSAVDPNPDPYVYWHSSQCAPKGLNDGCYKNPEADALMDQARREMDAGRRLAMFHRLHKIFRDGAPAIFVVNSAQRYAFRRNIRGLTSSPLSFFFWPGPVAWFQRPSPPPSPGPTP